MLRARPRRLKSICCSRSSMLLELTKAPTAGIGDRGLLLWLTQSTLARGPSHWQPLGREPKTLPA